jgi:hypothetical protein
MDAVEDDHFYTTMSGENILYMVKESPSKVLVTVENYETRVLDPILSKVRAGLSEIYIEEIPEWRDAPMGGTLVPRR